MKNNKWFGDKLLDWHQLNHRSMPWMGSKNAYRVWLSEVILQQTQVAQGLPYYEKFVRKYPSVKHLAAAAEQEVLKLWQGLGYYSRARNLLVTARQVVDHHGAKFPSSLEELKKLKGVGDYTAAAIASFAFDKPHAVVDGNVYRVLSRVFGIETPVDTLAGKKEFAALAQQLLDQKQPAAYNQAIMNFGAMVCKPQKPHCQECIYQRKCVANAQQIINVLPIKAKKTKVAERYFNYLVIISDKDEVLVIERKASDIWKGLYEFPMYESGKILSNTELLKQNALLDLKLEKLLQVAPDEPVDSTQLLSHQRIHARFFRFKTRQIKLAKPSQFKKVTLGKLHELPFPKTIAEYIQHHIYSK